jgi:Co/Zn/Cd efflux system component
MPLTCERLAFRYAWADHVTARRANPSGKAKTRGRKHQHVLSSSRHLAPLRFGVQRTHYLYANVVGVHRSSQAVRPTTLYASAAVNVVLMAMQVFIGRSAHSDALFADGVHSLVDLLADTLVLVTVRLDFICGRAHGEALTSFAIGALLIAAGCEMLWRAADHISGVPDTSTVGISAMGAAIFALIAKEALFRCMMREARRTQSHVLQANAWHARSDAVSALFVVLCIAGQFAGITMLDALAAMIIGLMIGGGAGPRGGSFPGTGGRYNGGLILLAL